MRPTAIDNPIEEIIAYTGPSFDATNLGPYLRAIPSEVSTGVNENLGGATVALPTGQVPAVNGGLGRQRRLSIDSDVLRRFGPDKRVAIGTAMRGNDPATIEYLFQGYATRVSKSIDSSRPDEVTIQLTSMTETRSKLAAAQICGAYMLTRAAARSVGYCSESSPNTLPGIGRSGVAAMPAERTIFNPRGKGNRKNAPVLVSIPPYGDQWVHVFCSEHCADAKPWTYLQILRYLVAFYFPTWLGVYEIGSLFDSYHSGGGHVWFFEEPGDDDLIAVQPGWHDMMVRAADGLCVDGLNFYEALLALSKRCGLQIHESHEASTTYPTCLTTLEFWCPGDGLSNAEWLRVERDASHRDSSGDLRNPRDIIDANDFSSGTLQYDWTAAAKQVAVVGGRRRLQITAELQPLWLPDELWDDVETEDQATYAASAMNPTGDFATRFNPGGDDFPEHRDVGRLWGLDTDHRCDPEQYDRTDGPYAGRYDYYWDLSRVSNTLAAMYPLTARNRRMSPVAAKTLNDDSLGVLVDISFDSGVTWHLVVSRFRVLGDRCAIWLGSRNLLDLAGDVAMTAGTNYYAAYMAGEVRLRATFCIELDDRLVGTGVVPVAAGLPDATRVMMREDAYDFVDTHSDDDCVLYGYPEYDEMGPPDIMAFSEDDTTRAERTAAALAAQIGRANLRANVSIPWLSHDEHLVGQVVRGILYGSEQYHLGGSANRRDFFPHIVSKVYRLRDQQKTEIVLGDNELRKYLGVKK